MMRQRLKKKLEFSELAGIWKDTEEEKINKIFETIRKAWRKTRMHKASHP